MTPERIKEIQQETAYPDSISVQQALLKVWSECEQERVKNCNTPDVSGSLHGDIPTYAEWIDKYFTWYRNDDLYKDKKSGNVYSQLELFNRYKKAYKGTEEGCQHEWIINTHDNTKYCRKGCDGFTTH